MSDAYIGEIQIFPITFIPAGWLLCDGRVLKIQQYQVLAAVIGAVYGGDGKTTFQLPNLLGQAVLGTGQTPVAQGGTYYALGEAAGENQRSVTLSVANMAAHTHTFQRAQTAQLTSKTATPSATDP